MNKVILSVSLVSILLTGCATVVETMLDGDKYLPVAGHKGGLVKINNNLYVVKTTIIPSEKIETLSMENIYTGENCQSKLTWSFHRESSMGYYIFNAPDCKISNARVNIKPSDYNSTIIPQNSWSDLELYGSVLGHYSSQEAIDNALAESIKYHKNLKQTIDKMQGFWGGAYVTNGKVIAVLVEPKLDNSETGSHTIMHYSYNNITQNKLNCSSRFKVKGLGADTVHFDVLDWSPCESEVFNQSIPKDFSLTLSKNGVILQNDSKQTVLKKYPNLSSADPHLKVIYNKAVVDEIARQKAEAEARAKAEAERQARLQAEREAEYARRQASLRRGPQGVYHIEQSKVGTSDGPTFSVVCNNTDFYGTIFTSTYWGSIWVVDGIGSLGNRRKTWGKYDNMTVESVARYYCQ